MTATIIIRTPQRSLYLLAPGDYIRVAGVNGKRVGTTAWRVKVEPVAGEGIYLSPAYKKRATAEKALDRLYAEIVKAPKSELLVGINLLAVLSGLEDEWP